MSGGAKHCLNGNSDRLSSGSLERVPQLLGATSEVTLTRRGTEEAGDDPATKHNAGDEDEEEATAA